MRRRALGVFVAPVCRTRAARSRGASVADDRRVLEGVGRLVVDGTNVLHALSRTPGQLPPAALIGRLRAVVPPGVSVVVILDGSPEHGLVSRRIASGIEVRYSGRGTADEAITQLVEREAVGGQRGGGPGTSSLLVVTDDIELAGFVRRAGARTVRNSWIVDRLARQRLSSPAPGRPVAGAGPTGSPSGTSSGDEPEERRWSPGRGATRKRGNPHRGR